LGNEIKKVYVVEKAQILEISRAMSSSCDAHHGTNNDFWPRAIIQPKKLTKILLSTETWNIVPINPDESSVKDKIASLMTLKDSLCAIIDIERLTQINPTNRVLRDRLEIFTGSCTEFFKEILCQGQSPTVTRSLDFREGPQYSRTKTLSEKSFDSWYMYKVLRQPKYLIMKKLGLTLNQVNSSLYNKSTIQIYKNMQVKQRNPKIELTQNGIEVLTRKLKENPKRVTMKGMLQVVKRSEEFPKSSDHQYRNAIKSQFVYQNVFSDFTFRRRNGDTTKIYRNKYAQYFMNQCTPDTLPLFFDESSFSSDLGDKKKWRNKIDNSVVCNNGAKGQNMNILGAISPFGFLGALLVKGTTCSEIISGFFSLLDKEIHSNARFQRFKNVLMIVDGASVNSATVVKKFVQMNPKWKIIVLPAYGKNLSLIP
jgi:hypothetical protein